MRLSSLLLARGNARTIPTPAEAHSYAVQCTTYAFRHVSDTQGCCMYERKMRRTGSARSTPRHAISPDGTGVRTAADKASLRMTEALSGPLQGVWVRRAGSALHRHGARVAACTSARSAVQVAKPYAQRTFQTNRSSDGGWCAVEARIGDIAARIAAWADNIGPSNSANRLQR